MDSKYPSTKYNANANRVPLFLPYIMPDGVDPDKVFTVEQWIACICEDCYDIDLDNDGVIVWWALGVFVDYIATKKSVTNTDMSFICVCSLALVLKYCLDEGISPPLSDVYERMLMKNKIPINELVLIEVDILTTLHSLVDCFRRHTPPGYAIDVLSLVQINSDNITN